MRVNSKLKAPSLVAVLLGWTCIQTPARAEIFTYRDDRGIIHFSNVKQHPRWIPLRVPPARRIPAAGEQKYPFASIVSIEARRHDIDADLVRAIIKVESDFDPRARSSKGAMGLMQVLPKTAQPYGGVDLYEPKENIRVGVQHLKLLLARFRNDLRLTLAAYNAGAAAVAKHGGVPPFPETVGYIRRVLRLYQSYSVPQNRESSHDLPRPGTE